MRLNWDRPHQRRGDPPTLPGRYFPMKDLEEAVQWSLPTKHLQPIAVLLSFSSGCNGAKAPESLKALQGRRG